MKLKNLLMKSGSWVQLRRSKLKNVLKLLRSQAKNLQINYIHSIPHPLTELERPISIAKMI